MKSAPLDDHREDRAIHIGQRDRKEEVDLIVQAEVLQNDIVRDEETLTRRISLMVPETAMTLRGMVKMKQPSSISKVIVFSSAAAAGEEEASSNMTSFLTESRKR